MAASPLSDSRCTFSRSMDRDQRTGQFIETEGGGRSDAERSVIAARRAKVAKLYPDKRPAAIGEELGWATPTIPKDVAWLVANGYVERQRLGPPRKHPLQAERECANPDCDERFTPESWELDRRFCSIQCARPCDRSPRVREKARELLTEQHRRAAEEIARLNAAGILTLKQFAAERKVTESAVSRYIAVGLLRA